nr:ribosome assembly RNA-binding protein YhbY [Nannocystis sp. SCPEA4]
MPRGRRRCRGARPAQRGPVRLAHRGSGRQPRIPGVAASRSVRRRARTRRGAGQAERPRPPAPGTLPRVNRPVLGAHSRAFLKSLAHHLAPVVQVGVEGISPEVVRAASIALEDHELIKVKLGQNFEGERNEAAEELAEQTGSAAVQVIGRVVVLYRRRSRDDPKKPRIELPRR